MGKNYLTELDVLLQEAQTALISAAACEAAGEKHVWERVASTVVVEALQLVAQEWSRREVRRARVERRALNVAPAEPIEFPEA